MDKVIIDLGNGAFAAGQTYVALSRCRTLEGIVLRSSVREKDLITSIEVQKFMKGEPIAGISAKPQLDLFDMPSEAPVLLRATIDTKDSKIEASAPAGEMVSQILSEDIEDKEVSK